MVGRAPQIDAASCVHGQARASACVECVAACPAQALQFTPEGIALDAVACTCCGGCVSACPQGAVSLSAPEPVRDRATAIVICARAPAAQGRPAPGCIRHAGLRVLAALWGQGVQDIACATGDCVDCPDLPPGDDGAAPVWQSGPLAGAAATLAALLTDRGLAAPRLRGATAGEQKLWRRRADEAPQPGRRALLLGAGADAPQGRGSLAGLQARPGAGGAAPRYAHIATIDPALCSGCDACIRLCPEQALIQRNDAGGGLCYDLDAAVCTGCRLCEDCCDEGAVTVTDLAQSPPPVPLSRYRCAGCGVDGHRPAAGPQRSLCPVCRSSGHHRKLFQVLT